MKTFFAPIRHEAPMGFWWWYAGSEGNLGV